MTYAVDRREVLLGSAALIAAAAFPLGVVEAAVAKAATALPAWAVGTPGEMNWMHVVAATEQEARMAFVFEHSGGDGCVEGRDLGNDECDCEACVAYRDCEVERQPKWDGKEAIGNVDWLTVGMAGHCDRCSYETDLDFSGGHIVADQAVCEDCMTLADWDIIDPEYAAELRENA